MTELNLGRGVMVVNINQASQHEPAQVFAIKDRFEGKQIQEWRPIFLVVEERHVASTVGANCIADGRNGCSICVRSLKEPAGPTYHV